MARTTSTLFSRSRRTARKRAEVRASALLKRDGWGVHCDGGGKAALFAMEPEDCARLASALELPRPQTGPALDEKTD
ncbi:MAG: DUF6157 family protein [Christensenellaceae bacterium]|nr:DUF6157 family protein [Christensenellaceae bacterium]